MTTLRLVSYANHFIQGRNTLAGLLKSVFHHGRHTFLSGLLQNSLSGTPLSNHLGNLWRHANDFKDADPTPVSSLEAPHATLAMIKGYFLFVADYAGQLPISLVKDLESRSIFLSRPAQANQLQ